MMVASAVLNAQVRPFLSSERKYTDIASDITGKIYLVNGTYIEQYDTNANKLRTFGNPQWGIIGCIDASIPSKVLVYYKESGIIALLNNDLSPAGNALNLFDKNWFNIDFATMGGSDKIILFDNTDKTLIITDLNLNKVSVSQLNIPEDHIFSDMQAVPGHRVALIDNSHGVCLLDYFGTYEKMVPLKEFSSLMLKKESFYYIQGDNLYRYDMPSFTQTMKIAGPLNESTFNGVKKFTITNDAIYFIDKTGIVRKMPLNH